MSLACCKHYRVSDQVSHSRISSGGVFPSRKQACTRTFVKDKTTQGLGKTRWTISTQRNCSSDKGKMSKGVAFVAFRYLVFIRLYDR